jgi:hypothetical protein
MRKLRLTNFRSANCLTSFCRKVSRRSSSSLSLWNFRIFAACISCQVFLSISAVYTKGFYLFWLTYRQLSREYSYITSSILCPLPENPRHTCVFKLQSAHPGPRSFSREQVSLRSRARASWEVRNDPRMHHRRNCIAKAHIYSYKVNEVINIHRL